MEQYAPPAVKEQIKAAVRPQEETKRQQVKHLYDKHVRSKISSYDEKKLSSRSTILKCMKDILFKHSSEKGICTQMQLMLNYPYGMLNVVTSFIS